MVYGRYIISNGKRYLRCDETRGSRVTCDGRFSDPGLKEDAFGFMPRPRPRPSLRPGQPVQPLLKGLKPQTLLFVCLFVLYMADGCSPALINASSQTLNLIWNRLGIHFQSNPGKRSVHVSAPLHPLATDLNASEKTRAREKKKKSLMVLQVWWFLRFCLCQNHAESF